MTTLVKDNLDELHVRAREALARGQYECDEFKIVRQEITRLAAQYAKLLNRCIRGSVDDDVHAEISTAAQLVREAIKKILPVKDDRYIMLNEVSSYTFGHLLDGELLVSQGGIPSKFPLINTRGIHHFALSYDGNNRIGEFHKNRNEGGITFQDMLMLLREGLSLNVYQHIFNEGSMIDDASSLIVTVSPNGTFQAQDRFPTNIPPTL